MVKMLERKIEAKEARITELQKCANVVLLVVNWILGHSNVVCRNEVEGKVLTDKLAVPTKMDNKIPKTKAYYANTSSLEEAITEVELANLEVFECENAFKSFHVEAKTHVAAVQTNIQEVSSTHKQLVRNIVKEILEMSKKYVELRERKTSRCCNVDSLSLETHQKFENQYLHQIRDELVELNGRLEVVENFILTGTVGSGLSFTSKRVCEDEWTADSSSSSFAFSIEIDSSGKKFEGSSCAYSEGEGVLPHEQDSRISHMLLANSINTQTTMVFLKKELEVVFDAFSKLLVRLATLDGPISSNCSHREGICLCEFLHSFGCR